MNIVLAYGHSGSGLIDTFMHGAAWSLARRFVSQIPMPIVIVAGTIIGIMYILRKIGKRGPVKTRRSVKAR